MFKDMHFEIVKYKDYEWKNTWMERQQEWEGEYVCCLIWEMEENGISI